MNQGQEKFYQYVMERVTDDNKDKANALLEESFAKQEDGTFNRTYLTKFIPEMLSYLKPESIEEVKEIMINFRA